jgi:uncharacterized membrane protein YbhN (UPF0104 family)
LATLALERLFDPVCFALLFLGATFVVPLPTQLVALRGMVGGGLVAGGVLLAYLARYKHRTWVGNNGLRGWRRQVDAFIEAARTLATGKRLGAAFLASVGVWVLQVGEFAFVANALHLGLPIGGSVAAMLLINTGLVLRLTPGNVGYFQFAYVVATAHFGVLADAAVASAILIQLLEAVPITLAGLAIAPGMMRRRRDAHPSPRLTGHPLFSMVSGGTNVPSRHIR